MEDDESKLFELNMALPLFKMISIDEGIKNVETETDIGSYFLSDSLFTALIASNSMLRSFDWAEAVDL